LAEIDILNNENTSMEKWLVIRCIGTN
jgi:hypothetical protein